MVCPRHLTKRFSQTTTTKLQQELFDLVKKYQGVKEFHMLARIGCKIMVFSPFITYYHSSKGNK